MMISEINTANTSISYKGKPVRRIIEKGFYEGYFMEQSPLTKGYNIPEKSSLKKIIANIQAFFNKIKKS